MYYKEDCLEDNVFSAHTYPSQKEMMKGKPSYIIFIIKFFYIKHVKNSVIVKVTRKTMKNNNTIHISFMKWIIIKQRRILLRSGLLEKKDD